MARRRFLVAVAVTAVASTAFAASSRNTGALRVSAAPEASMPRDAEPGGPDLRPRPNVPIGFAAGSSVLWASDADLENTFDVVARSGVDMVRFDISWTFAEPYRGHYEWDPTDRVLAAAEKHNLNVLATITNTPAWAAEGGRRHTGRPADATAYAEFVSKVAERYRDRVTHYEIWNEPNGRMFFEPMPDAVLYTSMLKLAYGSIKAVAPDATVVAGALGATGHTDGVIVPLEFLRQMYDNGAQGHFDALSYHPYDYEAPFAGGVLYETSPIRQMVMMQRLMVEHGDGDLPLWITEYGAPSSVVGQDRQAELVVQSLQQWPETSYAGAFFVHTVRDTVTASTDDEDTFGAVTDTYQPKSLFVELQRLTSAGNPPRPIDQKFRANADAALGPSVSPIFALGDGHGQMYEHGFLFETPGGFVTSPLDVGTLALAWQLLPSSPFADGYQDFGAGTRVRVFSTARTGTHVVAGGILDAWQPALGFPVTDQYPPPGADIPDERMVDFEHGTIRWSSASGATVTRY